jgi:bifunctional non-homologous end joining protein LigD
MAPNIDLSKKTCVEETMKLKPVIPFEPVATKRLHNDKHWVAQIKWDGIRMLTYFDGDEVRLVNRKLHDRTLQYPELTNITHYCKASSVILDGEIIAFDDKKPSFHEIMKRESLRKKQHIALAVKQTPITYMVFDVLYWNGGWVVEQPLAKRQQMLEEIIQPCPYVQLVQNFPDAEQLFQVVKNYQMEGVVCKDLSSAYAINGKDGRWQKKKWFLDLFAAVGGITLRNGIVNALLLGLYDNQGRFIYIGHAGTGKLTVSEWRDLTAKVQPIIINEKPFANEPERNKDAVWVKPEIVVKVQFLEWTSGGTMRQPSIQSFADLPASGCTFQQSQSSYGEI